MIGWFCCVFLFFCSPSPLSPPSRGGESIMRDDHPPSKGRERIMRDDHPPSKGRAGTFCRTKSPAREVHHYLFPFVITGTPFILSPSSGSGQALPWQTRKCERFLFPFKTFAHLYTTPIFVIPVKPGYSTRRVYPVLSILDTGLRRYDD